MALFPWVQGAQGFGAKDHASDMKLYPSTQKWLHTYMARDAFKRAHDKLRMPSDITLRLRHDWNVANHTILSPVSSFKMPAILSETSSLRGFLERRGGAPSTHQSIEVDECRDQFEKWVVERGIELKGVRLAWLGDMHGMVAERDLTPDDVVISIPYSTMITEKTMSGGAMMKWIKSLNDPILMQLPNLRVVLGLLYEDANPGSVWRPYLNLLPKDFSLPFHADEQSLLALESTALALDLGKVASELCRQYDYISVLISRSPKCPLVLPSFNSFLWAWSILMTRQNVVPVDGVDQLALIPVWDMCNHRPGPVTTAYNQQAKRIETYVDAPCKAGDQFYMSYGRERPLSDLFLYSGFIPDCLPATLNPSLPLDDQKLVPVPFILKFKLSLPSKSTYHTKLAEYAFKSPQVLSFHLDHHTENKNNLDILSYLAIMLGEVVPVKPPFQLSPAVKRWFSLQAKVQLMRYNHSATESLIKKYVLLEHQLMEYLVAIMSEQ
jgi:hypothetical protein